MMNADDKRLGLLLDVAQMHYREKMSKTKIANRLDTSSTQVGRYLKEAEALELVQFTFAPPRLVGLQAELLKHFDCLREAVVISTAGTFAFQLKMLGKVAAEYFDKNIESKMRVGISGGNTTYEMVEALPEKERNLQLFPTAIIGRGPRLPEHADPMVLLSNLWKRNRQAGQAYYATILPFEKARNPKKAIEERDEFLKRQKVDEVWKGMKETDIAFASVGPVSAEKEYQHGRTVLELLADINIDEGWLKQQGIVGDISYSFFNGKGETKDQWRFFLTLGVEHFREMAANPKKRVVLIAGKHKESVLKVALRGRLCNVLITDETTAETLLKI
jgi:deoxyribonucleoside regulator